MVSRVRSVLPFPLLFASSLLACSLDTKLSSLPGASSAAPAVSGSATAQKAALPANSADAKSTKAGGKLVKVYVSAEPSHASLFIDGEGPLSLPYSGQHAAAPASHQLRFEAPGFLPHAQNVSFERDFIFSVNLKPEPVKDTPEKSEKLPKKIADILGSASGSTKVPEHK